MWNVGFGRIIAIGALTACAALASPATAAPSDEAAACYNASSDAAITSCTRLIKSGKFNGSVLALLHVVRGNTWSSSKGQHDRAIADYDQAIQHDPKLAEAYHGRGNAYRAKGDKARAFDDYDKAISLDPNLVHAYTSRGLTYWANGAFDHAIADFDQAIRLKPGLAYLYFHRANAYWAKGDNARAIADYDQAIRRNPKLVAAYSSRALVYLQLGQFERAIADFDNALKADRQQARPLYGRGIAKLNKGDTAGGNADVAAANAIEPNIAKEFALLGLSAPEMKAVQPASTPAANCTAAETHWKSAEQIKTLPVYEDHLARFPNCDFAGLAAARIQSLKK